MNADNPSLALQTKSSKGRSNIDNYDESLLWMLTILSLSLQTNTSKGGSSGDVYDVSLLWMLTILLQPYRQSVARDEVVVMFSLKVCYGC